ncbi:MAG: GFA family protein [Gammaproteobacteria bacterium]|nr:GFA family protein [Gammaproteobacteria bacterium]
MGHCGDPTICCPHGAARQSTNVSAETAPGGCLCGAVRFTVTRPLREIVFCHCRQCRRQQGEYAAYTAPPREAIAIEDDRSLVWFASSESARRGFCRRCGSSLFWDRLSGDLLCIAAGALDDATRIHPECRVYVDSKAEYYDIGDGLDRYPGSRYTQRTNATCRQRRCSHARRYPRSQSSPSPPLSPHVRSQ